MSIAVSVFIPKRSQAWTAQDFQGVVTSAGFALALDPFDPALHVGTIPCRYQGVRTGFEYSHDPIGAYMQAVREMKEDDSDDFPYSEADLAVCRSHHSVVQLVTHSSFRARVAALITGACLAQLTAGVALDEPVWQWHAHPMAVAWARAAESQLQAEILGEGA